MTPSEQNFSRAVFAVLGILWLVVSGLVGYLVTDTQRRLRVLEQTNYEQATAIATSLQERAFLRQHITALEQRLTVMEREHYHFKQRQGE